MSALALLVCVSVVLFAALLWLLVQYTRARRRVSALLAAQAQVISTLHDGIAQDLTGISLLLRTVSGKDPGGTAQLATISAHVNRVIENARALARGLSPPQPADPGLLPSATPGPLSRASSGHAAGRTSPVPPPS